MTSSKNQWISYIIENLNFGSKEEKNIIAKYLIQDLERQGTYISGWNDFDVFISRLNQHEPLQYVTGVAHFLDLVLQVDNNVLIPRPETEELVMEVDRYLKAHPHINSILDIGTGSGCISIALALRHPTKEIVALDISTKALAVAQKNASLSQVNITWLSADFLNTNHWNQWPVPDMIISNPPYISIHEKTSMEAHVLDYEPHIALFPGADALAFYKAICDFALSAEKRPVVFCELNEFMAEATFQLFKDYGCSNVEILLDLQGKQRMLKAEW